jgi:hypothetical protein
MMKSPAAESSYPPVEMPTPPKFEHNQYPAVEVAKQSERRMPYQVLLHE